MLPDPDAPLVSILQAPFSYLCGRVYRGQEEKLAPDPFGSFTASQTPTRPGSKTPCLPPGRAVPVTSC